jgi:hypothetical protein
MENYTSDQLREDFINPLAELLAQLTDDARRLEQAVKDDELTRDYLPLNAKTALNAVGQLRKFRRQEVHFKLEQALEGTLKFRERELEKKRQKYHDQKKKSK